MANIFSIFNGPEVGADGNIKSGLFKGLSKQGAAAASAGINMAGGLAGGLLSNGMSSGVGSALQGLSGLAGAIPGPWGAAAGAGLSILGGAANALWGSSLNEGNIANIESSINQLENFNADAGSFDEYTKLTGPQTLSFTKSDVGKDGLFSSKASDLYNALKAKQANALRLAQASMRNNAKNLITNNDLQLMANLAAFGGPLHSNGTDWNTGITVVGNGGTHEQNPYEGVPMGIAEDGQPNLVEEGEVIFDDYVFSKRIKVPKAVRQKYKLRGPKELTFADAAKQAQKESEERPNDPISKRGLQDIMTKLMVEQESIRQQRQENNMKRQIKKYARGGKMGHLFDGSEPGPNILTSSWKWGDTSLWGNTPTIDFRPTLPTKPESVVNVYGMGEGNLPNYLLASPPPLYTEAKPNPNFGTPVWGTDGGTIHYSETDRETDKNRKRNEGAGSWLTGLRYVPALGAGIGVFSDLMGWTNTPDYRDANAVLDAMSEYDTPNMVKFNPIGDYLRYTPLDRLFYANQLGAQAGATRRNILNTAGGNRGAAIAGLLMADYNAQHQLGNLYRQAEEYNLGQRERVAKFNQSTNMFNSEGDLKAQTTNAELRNRRAHVMLDAAYKAAMLRNAADDRASQARSLNLTNLFDSLGNIGREAVARNMILSNPALYYGIGSNGKIFYKNGYESLSDAAKDEVNRHAAAKLGTAAHGGYLTIKRRR